MNDLKPESPAELLSRLRIGREEFCQRLLTSLILGAPYPSWNTRSWPSPQGLEFLRVFYELCFPNGWPEGEPVFVDEFELAARHDDEKGGAPDYAVLWGDRLWIIELKTERASHRPDQVPYYFDLAHHHYPEACVDLTYLTPALQYAFEPSNEHGRYAHATWDDVLPLIRATWDFAPTDPWCEVVEGLCDAIDSLESKPADWRGQFETVARQDQIADGRFAIAMMLVERTATDGEQRAIETESADLDALLELRLQLRDAIATTPPTSALRHVVPWLWRIESTGGPLTKSGAEHGYEIRLSRYEKPRD